jgi:hypothetical protein
VGFPALCRKNTVTLNELIQAAVVDNYSFAHPNPHELKTICFQLPRFTEKGFGAAVRNNQDFIHLIAPFQLNIMTPMGEKRLLLKARAFVCQHGSLRAGHYTAVTLIDDAWVLHDDSSTSEISLIDLSQKLKSEAYLAYYDVELIEE